MTTESSQEQQGNQPTEKFDDVFDEATRASPGDTEPDKGATAAAKQEQGQIDTVGAPATQPESEGKPSEPEGEQDYKALYEQERQKTKSWEGRISKADREAREAKARADELAAENQRLKAPTGGKAQDTGKTGPDSDDLTEEERAALEEMAREYPVINTAIQARAKQIAKSEVGPRVDKIEERVRGSEEETRRMHFDAIESAHADYRDYVDSGELDTWIESLPYRDALKWQEVKTKGNARQVIEMFNTFKHERQADDPQDQQLDNQQPAGQQDKAAAAEGVRRRGSIPNAQGGKAKASDFDGAFEEAVSVKR